MFKKTIKTVIKALEFAKSELIIIWGIISIITITTVIVPFFLNKKTILEATPVCISKSQLNIDCSFCGMSRAFIEISNGNYKNAYKLNKGSLYLYITFSLNFFIFVRYIIYIAGHKKINNN